MRAVLLLILALARLLWWDLHDKFLICLSWSAARRHIDRNVSDRARKLFALASSTVGMRLRVNLGGSPLPEQMIIVANHQSVIDIVVIMAAFRHHSVRFVAKAELRRWFPAVSRVLRVQRHALVHRSGNFAQAMEELDRLAGSLRERECIAIFPEGSRSRDGELKPFKNGAIRKLHARKKLPIVAVAVDGGARFSRLNDVVNIPDGHRYRVSVVAVYPAAENKQELLNQIRDAHKSIGAALEVWRRSR